MNAKHTPGPWSRKSIPGHLFEIHDADENPVFRIRGGMMPTLSDAMLIAAAPELLAALEWALDDPDSEILGEEWAKAARAAIAKAIGHE